MKKFQFQLESALSWRRQREQTERARLEDMAGRKAKLERRSLELQTELISASSDIATRSAVNSEDLALLDAFRRASDNQQRLIASELATLEAEIVRQRAALVEASRQTKLLEKLKTRRRAEWQRQADLALEQEASELYLAQWIQNQEPPS